MECLVVFHQEDTHLLLMIFGEIFLIQQVKEVPLIIIQLKILLTSMKIFSKKYLKKALRIGKDILTLKKTTLLIKQICSMICLVKVKPAPKNLVRLKLI